MTQDAQDRKDESVGAKEGWADLEAAAAAGDPEAVARLAKDEEDMSEGAKEGWAEKKAEEAAE